MIRRVFVALCMIGTIGGLSACASTPQSGEIGVVRNGSAFYWPLDWFDNHNIRGYVNNGSGSSWVGLGSEVHYYPVDSQQRFFKMESCYGSGSAECTADAPPVTVPTADGVEVTIQGTFYLNTAFNDSPAGHKALADFDTQFSTRTFGDKHPYDGTEGWSNFLGAIIEPIVANNLRDTISGVTCAELVSSCALVQNQAKATVDPNELSAKNNQSNVSRVQDAVQRGLAGDLETTLGRAYFKEDTVQFKLKAVTLPGQVQNAINAAQSAFAEVSKAQASVQSAKADAQANRIREAGYTKCPTCAAIDSVKAWKGTGVTTVVTGGASVAVGK